METGRGAAIFLLAIFLISDLPLSICAKKSAPVARKEDVPFIKCQVCEKIARQLHQLVKKKEAQIFPKKVCTICLLVFGFLFIILFCDCLY